MSEYNSSEDNLQMLFPTVVQVSQILDCSEMNQQLLEAVNDIRNAQSNSKPESWGLRSVHHDWQSTHVAETSIRQDYFAPLQKTNYYNMQIAWAMTPRIISHVWTECWLNIYASGHSQEIHLHRNNMFSGIYYVRAPENSGATLFYSPLADVMLEPRSAKGNSLNAKVSGFSPVEGRMLIFRSTASGIVSCPQISPVNASQSLSTQ